MYSRRTRKAGLQMTITHAGSPQTATDLAACAAGIARPIPPAYRAFLLQHNGGHPDPADFRFADSTGDGGSVAAFLGVNAPDFMDLEHHLHVYRNRIPPTLFPIARDPGGNLIPLATAGPDHGTVYFWDHEAEAEEGDPPTTANLTRIAANFAGFLSSLDNRG